MRLTRFGFHALLFYGLLVGAFFASPYSNLFFLLLAFLTLQWLVALVDARRNLRGVACRLGTWEPVPDGRPGAVRVWLEASGRPRLRLAVEATLSDGARLVGRVDRLAGAAELRLAVPVLARGVRTLERIELRSNHPLGLLVATRRFTAHGELVVYPAPEDGAGGRAGAGAGVERVAPGASSALQPAGLRDYRDGDDPRAIHQRASARRARPVLLEWEGGGREGAAFVLDRRCPPAALERELRRASRRIAAEREARTPLAFVSQGLDARFGPGARPWAELLRFLALAQPLPADAPAPEPRRLARRPEVPSLHA